MLPKGVTPKNRPIVKAKAITRANGPALNADLPMSLSEARAKKKAKFGTAKKPAAGAAYPPSQNAPLTDGIKMERYQTRPNSKIDSEPSAMLQKRGHRKSDLEGKTLNFFTEEF